MKILQATVLLTIGALIGVLATLVSNGVQYPLGSAIERISPADHIAEQDIRVYEDRVEIKIDSPKWASFADTNSMDPVFDAQSNAIQIQPRGPDQIEVGDIITYKKEGKNIIHRVIEKNIDGEGWYFIVKGDNNNQADEGKIRFEDVSRVVVAVIY